MMKIDGVTYRVSIDCSIVEVDLVVVFVMEILESLVAVVVVVVDSYHYFHIVVVVNYLILFEWVPVVTKI